MSTIKSSAENLTLNADGANNDVIIQSNGSTKVTVDGATGNVGIGTSAPARLFAVNTGGTKTDTNTKYVQNLVQSNEGSNQACLGVYFKGASSAADRIFQLQPAELGVANDGLIEVNPDGGKFRANRGVLFNTDTAAANTLDDYEEGTWTPALRGSSTAGNHTYHGRNGVYTKVGRAVHIEGQVHLNAINTMSGTIYVTGLPFTVGTSGFAINFSYAGAMSITAGTVPIGYSVASGTEFVIYHWDVTSGTSALNQSEIGSNTQVVFSGTYFI